MSSASAAATQNAERQPTCWPSQVAAGTPTTLATESPIITVATARPSRPRGARLGRDQRGDAEVGAVRDAARGTARGGAARRQPASALSALRAGVRRHQRDEQAAPRQPGAEEREHRRADDDAEGVRRDQVAGGRDRDVDAVGDLGQQTHRHELRGADREPAHGQREQRQAEAERAGVGRRRGGVAVVMLTPSVRGHPVRDRELHDRDRVRIRSCSRATRGPR